MGLRHALVSAAALTPTSPFAAAFGGTCLLAAAMGIGRFAYTPLLPPMQDALGWTVTQAGDVAAANYLGYMIGALAAAGMAHGPARLRWLAAALVASAATTLAGAAIDSLHAWLAVRFLSGVASAFCLVLGTAVVMEHLVSRLEPKWGALHFAGVGLGIVVAVLVIELARLAGASVFGQWGALGVASVAMLACAWAIVCKLPGQAGAASSAAARAATPFPRPSALLKRLIVAYGLFGFGYVVTATFIVAIVRRLEHAPLLEPLAWIVVGLLAGPSVFIWQRVAQRLGVFATLRLAYALEAAGVLLAGLASDDLAVLVGGALLGGTFMGITALGLIAARQAAGAHQDRAIGWMTASFGLGQLVGPAVAGRLAQLTDGFGWPSAVAAALLVTGIALLRGLDKA
jgi:predicted MFS family arabinose efflux permease